MVLEPGHGAFAGGGEDAGAVDAGVEVLLHAFAVPGAILGDMLRGVDGRVDAGVLGRVQEDMVDPTGASPGIPFCGASPRAPEVC